MDQENTVVKSPGPGTRLPGFKSQGISCVVLGKTLNLSVLKVKVLTT